MNADRDKAAFRISLTEFAALHGRRMTDQVFYDWWESLCDLTWQQFAAGLKALEHAGDARWPRPIDLRRALGSARQESEAELQARRERDAMEAEAREIKSNPLLFARNKRRLRLLTECVGGAHRAKPLEDCDSCQFTKRHPASHMHFVGKPAALTAADIDWSGWALGCCG